MAPLIIVIVEIAGFILGQHQAVLQQLYSYLASTAGPAAVDGIRGIVTATLSQRRAGAISQMIGWAIFVAAAIGLFSSLQDALNTVWDVQPPKRSILVIVRERLLSFGTVLTIAFLLLVSLGLNSLLTIAGHALADVTPALPTLLKVLEFIVSLVLIAALFAMMFKFLPECEVRWGDVWIGAAVSALLFLIGQFLLGWYLGRAAISSGYGAFGGIVVFLIWVNYSAQIMLFGAEFTHVYARRRGLAKR